MSTVLRIGNNHMVPMGSLFLRHSHVLGMGRQKAGRQILKNMDSILSVQPC